MTALLTKDDLINITGYERTGDQKKWFERMFGYTPPINGQRQISMTPEIVRALELKRAEIVQSTKLGSEPDRPKVQKFKK